MKVLHIVKTATGATWVYHQVRVLRKLGLEIVVALPSATEGLAPRYRECGAEVMPVDLDFPAQRPWRLPTILQACRALVQQVKPDLIHTHHVGTTLVTRLALGKRSPIRRLFQVAGPLHLEHAFFAWLDRQTAGPADSWIATCRWTQQKYLEMGISAERVWLCYAGTDISPFGTARTNKLRRELGVAHEAPLVGMVAYMYAPRLLLGQTRGLKGHEDFIAAMRLLRERRPDALGVIIGGPWGNANRYERRLRDMGRDLCGGSLIFTGHRADVAEIYPDLDVAVVPSRSENLGGAVEPLLCGVPVVATCVGGLPDAVREGETGWLVPPRAPDALARGVLRALENPVEARRRAMQGRKLMQNLLDVQQTARQTANIYEQALNLPVRQ